MDLLQKISLTTLTIFTLNAVIINFLAIVYYPFVVPKWIVKTFFIILVSTFLILLGCLFTFIWTR